MSKLQQESVYRGIYEFDDPSGCLLACRVPHTGSADLYSGTAVIVRPNQCAFFIFKGKIADIFGEGTHSLETESVPLLTKLANWRFGFRNPLRCELWFFSSQVYTARRWGTMKPVLHNFPDMPSVPIRAYGNFNITIKDPKKFYATLVGSRSSYDITELEEFVQGQILELFPKALAIVKDISSLNLSQDDVSRQLQNDTNLVLFTYGIKIVDMQVLSLLPSDEIIKALDTKAAMKIIGNKQEYLLYQAANSLSEAQSGGSGNNPSNDPMQMMLGMMLGKTLMASDFREKEKKEVRTIESTPVTKKSPGMQKLFCTACGKPVRPVDKFCSSCGGKR